MIHLTRAACLFLYCLNKFYESGLSIIIPYNYAGNFATVALTINRPRRPLCRGEICSAYQSC